MSKKRLYKSQNKMLCGVCGGFADFLNIDPTIVRIIFLIVTICSFGTGVLIYIVSALIMPERPLDDQRMKSANLHEEDYRETSEKDREFNSHFSKK